MRRIRIELMRPAKEFLRSLPEGPHKKITYNIERVLNGDRNPDIFNKLEGSNIWELRTLYNEICYRLFAFWDKTRESFIVVTHGIVKKDQKTRKKEIKLAEDLCREWYNEN